MQNKPKIFAFFLAFVLTLAVIFVFSHNVSAYLLNCDGSLTGDSYQYGSTGYCGSTGTVSSGSSGYSNASVPSVYTRQAEDIRDTSATAVVDVNPNGFDTRVVFEWGYELSAFSSGQTSKIPSLGGYNVGSGNSNVPVYADLKPLVPDRLYYYRARATNSNGAVVYGEIIKFKTLQTRNNTGSDTGSSNSNSAQSSNIGSGSSSSVYVPYIFGGSTASAAGRLPAIVSRQAENITDTRAKVTADVNPSGSPTIAWFEWGLSSSGLINETQPQNVGSDSGYISVLEELHPLSPGGTYYYRAVARSDEGISYGSTLSFNAKGVASSLSRPAIDYSLSSGTKNLTFDNGTETINSLSIGDEVQYILSITNTGTSVLNNIRVKNSLSSNLEFVESSPPPVSVSAPGIELHIDSLSQNETKTVYVKVRARSVENSAVIYNFFTVEAVGLIKNSNRTTSVLNPWLMAVSASTDKPSVDEGELLQYLVRYRNVGIEDVDNLTVKFILPEGVFLVSTEPAIASVENGTLFFDAGSFQKNKIGLIIVKVRVKDSAAGENLVATAFLDFTDSRGVPQQTVETSVSATVNGGLLSLASAAVFLRGNLFWIFLPWFIILLLILYTVYTRRKIYKILKEVS